MSQPEIGFRTAAFGFRREDVLEFITKETEERQKMETELKNVREDADQLREEKQEADKASKALISEHDRILEERTAQDKKITALQKQVRDAEDRVAAMQSELDTIRKEREELQKALNDIRLENTDLSSKCTEYDKARDRLAEIELCAHERAEKIRQDAEQEACMRIEQAQQMAGQLLAAVTQTRETYWKALTDMEQERERAHTDAVEALSHLDGLMNELRGCVVEQAVDDNQTESETVSDCSTEKVELHDQQQFTSQKEVEENSQRNMAAGRERPTLAQVLGALHPGK